MNIYVSLKKTAPFLQINEEKMFLQHSNFYVCWPFFFMFLLRFVSVILGGELQVFEVALSMVAAKAQSWILKMEQTGFWIICL